MTDREGESVDQESQTKEKPCGSCGGTLVRINSYEYQCSSCGRKYYVSANRLHKVSVRMSAGRIIMLCIAAAIVVGGMSVAGYQFYTGRLVASASRFSVVFRDFVMEVYEKPASDISEEDLSRIKYLRIEKDKDYLFTYSFEDIYDYQDPAGYEKTLGVVSVDGKKEDFSPSNVQYFTGLTRLELYTEAWQNYTLPEDNVLRYLICTDGLSRYGTPEFFKNVNKETLEEVLILKAEKLEDFSFMEDLQGIKGFLLEEAALKNTDMFQGFDRLEQLVLFHVEMKEEDTFRLVEELLSLPSLKRFAISGKTAWYITDEQWEQLEQTYGDRVAMVRE